MDSAIRAKAGKGKTSDGASVNDDLDAATKAIKAGDHARAINLMNRALRNAKGADKARIRKQRDALARKVMGR